MKLLFVSSIILASFILNSLGWAQGHVTITQRNPETGESVTREGNLKPGEMLSSAGMADLFKLSPWFVKVSTTAANELLTEPTELEFTGSGTLVDDPTHSPRESYVVTVGHLRMGTALPQFFLPGENKQLQIDEAKYDYDHDIAIYKIRSKVCEILNPAAHFNETWGFVANDTLQDLCERFSIGGFSNHFPGTPFIPGRHKALGLLETVAIPPWAEQGEWEKKQSEVFLRPGTHPYQKTRSGTYRSIAKVGPGTSGSPVWEFDPQSKNRLRFVGPMQSVSRDYEYSFSANPEDVVALFRKFHDDKQERSFNTPLWHVIVKNGEILTFRTDEASGLVEINPRSKTVALVRSVGLGEKPVGNGMNHDGTGARLKKTNSALPQFADAFDRLGIEPGLGILDKAGDPHAMISFHRGPLAYEVKLEDQIRGYLFADWPIIREKDRLIERFGAKLQITPMKAAELNMSELLKLRLNARSDHFVLHSSPWLQLEHFSSGETHVKIRLDNIDETVLTLDLNASGGFGKGVPFRSTVAVAIGKKGYVVDLQDFFFVDLLKPNQGSSQDPLAYFSNSPTLTVWEKGRESDPDYEPPVYYFTGDVETL